MAQKKKVKTYWGETRKLLAVILLIWIVVSFGASIIFAQTLNQIQVFGYPLGFWFSQQGSIYIFIALIFIYTKLMGKLDRKYDVHER